MAFDPKFKENDSATVKGKGMGTVIEVSRAPGEEWMVRILWDNGRSGWYPESQVHSIEDASRSGPGYGWHIRTSDGQVFTTKGRKDRLRERYEKIRDMTPEQREEQRANRNREITKSLHEAQEAMNRYGESVDRWLKHKEEEERKKKSHRARTKSKRMTILERAMRTVRK